MVIVFAFILASLCGCSSSRSYDIPELHVSLDMSQDEIISSAKGKPASEEYNGKTYISSTESKLPAVLGLPLRAYTIQFNEDKISGVILHFDANNIGIHPLASYSQVVSAYTEKYGEPTNTVSAVLSKSYTTYELENMTIQVVADITGHTIDYVAYFPVG